MLSPKLLITSTISSEGVRLSMCHGRLCESERATHVTNRIAKSHFDVHILTLMTDTDYYYYLSICLPGSRESATA